MGFESPVVKEKKPDAKERLMRFAEGFFDVANFLSADIIPHSRKIGIKSEKTRTEDAAAQAKLEEEERFQQELREKHIGWQESIVAGKKAEYDETKDPLKNEAVFLAEGLKRGFSFKQLEWLRAGDGPFPSSDNEHTHEELSAFADELHDKQNAARELARKEWEAAIRTAEQDRAQRSVEGIRAAQVQDNNEYLDRTSKNK